METTQDQNQPSIKPQKLELPKGGGAIKGISESFETNFFTGSGSFSIPIPLPTCRNLTPSLSVGYSSGSGNSSFGIGFNVSVSSVFRKTSKKVPTYDDNDVFVLSDDLVKVGENLYQPRIEGSFARIERKENHWEVTDRDGSVSIYGREAKVYDPENNQHVAEWLLEETTDVYGNKINYHYRSSAVDPKSKVSGKVLDKITYGYNKEKNYNHFEILFDYDAGSIDDKDYLAHSQAASLRKDPFSSYEKGFCVRNEILCRAIRIYHRFDELGKVPKLVNGTYFDYDEKETITYLRSVRQVGYFERDGKRFSKSTPTTLFSYNSDDSSYVATVSSVELKDGEKLSKQLLRTLKEQNYEFSENNTKITAQNSFWKIEDDKKSIFLKDKGSFFDLYDQKNHDQNKQEFKPVTIDNLSGYLDGEKFQLIDLYQEGIEGILYNDGTTILYFRPNGNGEFSSAQLLEKFPILNRPSYSLLSLEGDGTLQLYANDGYHDFQDGQWSEFKTIESSVTSRNELQEMIDVTGDGRLDIIVFEGPTVRVYPSQGKKGYKNPIYQMAPEGLPNRLSNSESSTVRFADMFGDGKSHLVKIENGNVECWPNLGYGKFGEKITFKNAPYFRDGFDAKRLYFADIDGSGTTDFVYAHHDHLSIYYNNSGNSFSHEFKLYLPIEYNQISRIEFADILGNGTNCLLLTYIDQNLKLQHKYYDFYNNTKPHLLKQMDNNMGNITRLFYASSTKFYLEDRNNGTPWVTSLPFPVQVIEKIETIDNIANSRLTNKFKYHHGFYDYTEKEFRGFGLVETWDTEDFEKCEVEEQHYVAPVYTKTWYHTGAYKKSDDLIDRYRKEFYNGDTNALVITPHLFEGIDTEEDRRQGYRALNGQMLRQEIYGLDSDSPLHPYSVTESSAKVKLLKSHNESDNEYGVFFVNLQETINYHYEKNPNDPRIQHDFVLEVDDYGNVKKSASITYPRRRNGYNEQKKLYASLECNDYINNVEDFYLLGVPYRSQGFELGGLNTNDNINDHINDYIKIDNLRSHVEKALNNKIRYEESLSNTPQARLLAESNNYYWNKEQDDFLPLSKVTQQALLHHIETIAFSDNQIKEVFANKITSDKELQDLGYKKINDSWYAPSSVQYYYGKDRHYLTEKVVEAFGAKTRVIYDDYNLLPLQTILEVTDSSNYETIAEYDYQRLTPIRLIDNNDNISEVILNPLGVVIATSVYGKGKGDKPLSEYKVIKDIGFEKVLENPGKYLQNATSFFYYDLDAWRKNGQPVHVVNLQRETHVSESETSRIRKTIIHMDGFGRNLETKLLVEDGKWLTSGRVIYNNKEKEIKKYEPFYSNRPYYDFEEAVHKQGVSSIYYYDPLLRNIRIDNPKGFFSKIEFCPWTTKSFDLNDTIEDSSYYKEFTDRWNSASEKKTLENEKDALDKALKHKNTPKIEHLDTLGRKFLEIEILRKDNQDIELKTHVKLDIQGNELESVDARFYEKKEVKNFQHIYSMSGILKSISIDAGESWTLSNVAGSNVHNWSGKGRHIYTEYDKLQRPVVVKVTDTDLNLKDNIVERFFYSENVQDKATNRYGTLIGHYDQAGLTIVEENDFKGQTLKTSYHLRKNYKNEANWTGVNGVITKHPDLEEEIFKSSLKYDAIGQVTEKTDPQNNVHIPVYDVAGRVKEIKFKKPGKTSKTYVSNIDYNAKGQRERIIYGNGVITSYTYDKNTFRLIKLESIKENKKLQDIEYIDDPAGNITRIIDNSYKNIFQNSNADSKSDYEYDSLYRLIKATGREHAGINAKESVITLPHINDQNGISNYTEYYDFDNAGNIIQTRHTGAVNFTNKFYISNKSNRSLPILDDIAIDESDIDAKYDESGNLLQINNNQKLNWNYRNNISHVDIIIRPDNKNDSEYYVYNNGGQRIRKVTETYQKENHTVVDKIYFGDMEITRKYQNSLKEEKYTINISDDKNKVAIHSYWTKHNEYEKEEGKNRYQLQNHLDSISLELNDDAEIITYEEYLPFGGTALIAGRTVREVTEKEYRYSGKERDNSTGLYYYGARYYAPWLLRWINPDPAGTVDGLNLYAFVRGNPVRFIDNGGENASDIAINVLNIFIGIIYGVLGLLSGIEDFKAMENDFKAMEKIKMLEEVMQFVGTVASITSALAGIASSIANIPGINDFFLELVQAVGLSGGIAGVLSSGFSMGRTGYNLWKNREKREYLNFTNVNDFVNFAAGAAGLASISVQLDRANSETINVFNYITMGVSAAATVTTGITYNINRKKVNSKKVKDIEMGERTDESSTQGTANSAGADSEFINELINKFTNDVMNRMNAMNEKAGDLMEFSRIFEKPRLAAQLRMRREHLKKVSLNTS